MPAALWLLSAMLIVMVATGGSARADAASLLFLRPALIIGLAVLGLSVPKIEFATVRIPLLLLICLATIIAMQLVELPRPIWMKLPGREIFDAPVVASDDWRAVSLSPDRTLNSLLALLPAFAVLLGIAALDKVWVYRLFAVIILMALAHAVLGALQFTMGPHSPLYLYEYNNRGVATGFFANRNHLAAFCAAMLPLLRCWMLFPFKNPGRKRARDMIALAIAGVMIVMVLVSGSRTGLVLLGLSLALTLVIRPIRTWPWRGGRIRASMVVAIAIFAFFLLALFASFLGRFIAIDRIGWQYLQADLRVVNFPVMVQMLQDMWPLGSGFGSFDYLFRAYEPLHALDRSYFNNAHNDLMELAITGGLPALAVVAVFMFWCGRASYLAFSGGVLDASDRLVARSASISIFLLLLASLTDYPLRTPMMAGFFALLCGLLAVSTGDRDGLPNCRVAEGE